MAKTERGAGPKTGTPCDCLVAARRDFDTLVVWRLQRLAVLGVRPELVQTFAALVWRGVAE